jgi:hypothetical protein
MISFCYLGSAAMLIVTAILFAGGSLAIGSFMALVVVTFFIASAGASSAYLTVSEIFPMETRALAIASFYAVGTAVGGITGPILFARFIDSGSVDQVALGFYIGAAVMIVGGLAEIAFGVPAERKPLEQVAEPLTAEDAAQAPSGPRQPPRRRAPGRYRPGPGRISSSPGMAVSTPWDAVDVHHEADAIVRALEQHGPTDRRVLAERVGSRYWGPGLFRHALGEALRDGRAYRLSRTTVAPTADRETSSTTPDASH